MNEKQKIMNQVLEIWNKHPHLRLGQLILNAHNGQDFYYESNEEFIEKLNEFSKERLVQGVLEK